MEIVRLLRLYVYGDRTPERRISAFNFFVKEYVYGACTPLTRLLHASYTPLVGDGGATADTLSRPRSPGVHEKGRA